MSGLIGQSNGLSFQTNAQLKQMEKDASPSPPPVEQVTNPAKNQVGTTELTNESGLRAALAARKMSPAEIDRQVEQYKKASGRR